MDKNIKITPTGPLVAKDKPANTKESNMNFLLLKPSQKEKIEKIIKIVNNISVMAMREIIKNAGELSKIKAGIKEYFFFSLFTKKYNPKTSNSPERAEGKRAANSLIPNIL